MKKIITLGALLSFCLSFAQTVDITPIFVTCKDASDGIIKAEVVSGTPPFNYELKNLLTSQIVDTQTSADMHALFTTENLGPGKYLVTINNFSNSAGIGQPNYVTFSHVSTDANGGLNGSIEVTNPLGGNYSAGYSYSIDGASFQNSNVFTGLASGNHDIQVMDNSVAGCTSDVVVVAVGGTSASVKEQNLPSFKVYPNPSSNFLVLPTNLVGTKYEVYSFQGKKVLSGKLKSKKVELKSLANGTYLLKVEKHKTIKFVKK